MTRWSSKDHHSHVDACKWSWLVVWRDFMIRSTVQELIGSLIWTANPESDQTCVFSVRTSEYMIVHCHQLVHHIATNLWTYQGFGQFGVPGVCETFTFSPPYGCVCGRSWVVISHPKEFMNCCAIPECSANCIASQRVAQHGYALQHHWKKLTLATPVCCKLPSGSSSSSVFEST